VKGTIVQEQRIRVRREADRELLERAGGNPAPKKGKKEDKRALRRAIRHACKAELNIEISHQQGDSKEWTTSRQRVSSRVLDLSEEGASFFTRYAANTNQTFEFRIKLYDGKEILGLAEVRWVKQKESARGYAVGTQFSRIDAENLQRIRGFLMEMDSTLGMGSTIDVD
jgi:hypothetical protein